MAQSSESIVRHLENKSLSILADSIAEVRASGSPSLQDVSDDDLRVALYTVLLRIIDVIREGSRSEAQEKPTLPTIFRDYARNLMEFIDGQSAYTVGHTWKVVQHVVHIASRLNLSDKEVENLELAAWIHNIGLINQYHRLATLARPLSPDELKQARNHTVVGAELIRPIEFLSPMVPVVRYHHNHYDGSTGKPRGEALPLGARIIALADAYQAMLEPRAYRPALTRQQALIEIQKGSGTQFDPNLVPFSHELT